MGNCSKEVEVTAAGEVLSLDTQVMTSDCTEDAECWSTCPLRPMSVTSMPGWEDDQHRLVSFDEYDRAFLGRASGHRLSPMYLQLIYIGRNMVHNRS